MHRAAAKGFVVLDSTLINLWIDQHPDYYALSVKTVGEKITSNTSLASKTTEQLAKMTTLRSIVT